MKLEHVALNITDTKEIVDFYQNILGMIEVRNYELDKDLAKQFFNINKATSVHLMQNSDLAFELFVNKNYVNNSFSHVCIKVNNREEMVEKAIADSYKCIRREREYSDQIFISDKSGNLFEIKTADINVN